MRAVLVKAPGGPEVLALEEVADPSPGPGDTVVRVRACALNHLDVFVRQGVRAYGTALPHILGADVAGEVEAIGPGVEGWTAGDRVVVSPGISCWQCDMCTAGHDNLCRHYRLLGAHRWGGYAERLLIPAGNLLPSPGDLTWEEAAAVPLVFVTAWHMLVTRAGLKPGETVLVLAAGSGVGSAAIQIARACGARVIATAGADWKLEKAQELGAHEVFNYQTEGIRDAVARLTDKRGVDVVVEHVGAATFGECVKALAPNGRLVTCGATSGPEVTFDARYLYSRQQTLLGSMMGTRRELEAALRLVAQGRLRPVVGRTFPLAEARAAHEALERREVFGKIVLTVE